MRCTRVPALVAVAAFGALLLVSSTASADSGTLSAQYQAYSATSGGPDPYASSNPQDVHVDGYGGQPEVTGYVKLNLDSLPSASNIDGLTLSLTPNASQTDNVNASAASIEACLLTQPLTSSGYQATPLTADCTLPHAAGEPQPNGDWHFELAPLAQYWQKNQNDGLALIATAAPVQAGVPVAPTAWSIGFDHTKTTAAVDYSSGTSASVVALAPSQGGGSQALFNPAPAPALVPPAALPTEPAPTAAAAATPRPTASAAPAVSGGAPASPAGPHVNQQWVWLTAGLAGAVLLMLLLGASQQVLRTGRVSVGAFGAALSHSRSQLAAPVATLALASVFALGFSGQANALGASGAGARGGGGSATAGGMGTGVGATPGSSTPGATAPGSTALPGGRPSGATSAAGGAGTAANGNTNGGNNGPGVTATTVRVGFVYITNSQAANQAFGFQVASTGNEQSEEQALVDYVNKHGGIGGRQVVPVFVAVDFSKAESDPTVFEEVCHSLTEDYHVFAVVDGSGPPDATNADACYAQHGTINFDGGFGEADLAFLRQASPYIWADESVALDRGMRWEVSGLQSRGFFAGATNKLGVIVADDSVNDRVYNQVTLPALQSAGVSQPLEFKVPHDTLSDLANTMKQAVVQFQAKGITNVIFQGGGGYGGGSYAVLFMVDSESQHYNPRYGLSSSDGPVGLVANVPQDQFQNALAVGVAPALDTDDQHYLPWPSTANEKTCASLQAAAGNSFTSREGAMAIIAYCDNVFDLQQGAQGLTTLNAQLWADHLMQLGAGVFNDSMYRPDIGPDHWDAAGGYRLLHAVLNCEGSNACFVYDNATVYSS